MGKQLDPVGHIFIFEDDDLAVLPNASDAEGFIEPQDVDLGEIYDEAGQRLKARVVRGRKTQLNVMGEEPIRAALAERVEAFLAAIGERVPMPKDDPEYLRNAALKVIAWQQNQTLGRMVLRRIRGLLRARRSN